MSKKYHLLSKKYHLYGASGIVTCITCKEPLIVKDISNDNFEVSETCTCNYITSKTIYTRTWLEDVAQLELIPIKGQRFNPFKKWKAKARK
jgi:hypothetical protein